MPKTMIDPLTGEPVDVARFILAFADRSQPAGPLHEMLEAAATYIRELEAALETKNVHAQTGQFFMDMVRGMLESGVNVDTPPNKVIDGYIHGWSKQQRRIEELEAEVARLKAGKLTPDEFNELCHNLHETGQPLTRCEHEAACTAFREQLYGPPGLSVAEACHEHTSPD